MYVIASKCGGGRVAAHVLIFVVLGSIKLTFSQVIRLVVLCE